jgi:hypothetical protein
VQRCGRYRFGYRYLGTLGSVRIASPVSVYRCEICAGLQGKQFRVQLSQYVRKCTYSLPVSVYRCEMCAALPGRQFRVPLSQYVRKCTYS